MGICIQKSTPAQISRLKNARSNRESFLYNSFTYDPTYSNDASIFFFEVPHYGEIQYILRKGSEKGKSKELQAVIEQHISQINEAITKFKSEQFMPGLKSQKQEQPTEMKSEPSAFSKSKEQKRKQFEMGSTPSPRVSPSALSNVLNIELVSATFSDCDPQTDIQFDVHLNEEVVMSVCGNIEDNKWKPVENNQISVADMHINLDESAQSSNKAIKLACTVNDGEVLQCTIPCNKIIFKYVVPLIQTTNIRLRTDNQPFGHVHFRVEYIGDFESHKAKVIKDLQCRKAGLQSILDRIQGRKFMQEDSLVIEENAVSSFLSEIKQDS